MVVTSYPLLLRDVDALAEHQFHLAILDEAQTIKNPRSQAHHAAVRLQAAHRLCLTGTPLENHLEELWSLFQFLGPGLLGDAEAFRRRYRAPIERPYATMPFSSTRASSTSQSYASWKVSRIVARVGRPAECP